MPKPRLLSLSALALCVACGSEGTSPSPASLTGKILFVAAALNGTDQADIYAINPDGTGLTNLTNHPAFYGPPAPSPDGTRLAFYRSSTSPSDSGDIYTLAADGTNLQQVTFTAAEESSLSWRHDGGRLMFVKNRDIYTMAPDGSDTTRLTTDGTDYKTTPAWSPNGTFIVYSRYIDATAGYDLHRITASGQNDTSLTSLAGDDLSPAWNTDGQSLVFVHQDLFAHLLTLDLATGDTATVTSGPVIDQTPAWSPGGDSLAFVRNPNALSASKPQEVYLLVPGSGTPVPVTSFARLKFAHASTWTNHP